MFFNISNHLSYTWGEEQKKEALEWGQIVDMQFPNVNPAATIEEIEALAKELTTQIKGIMDKEAPNAAMVQGEYTTVHQLLKHMDPSIKTLAATSTRNTDGKFVFVGLRPYETD